MINSLQHLTKIAPLSELEIIKYLITGILVLLSCYIGIFINIYCVDKIEFLYNEQTFFEFKFNMRFIITYSKNKKIISKKTFILELIGYVIVLYSIITFVISLCLKNFVSLVVFSISYVAAIIFLFITSVFFNTAKRKHRNMTL